MTCIAFSISKPFRRSFWTNKPFAVSVVLLFLINTAIVFVPGQITDWYFKMTSNLSFKDDDGQSYYDYTYLVFLIIAINSVTTYAAEKLIIEKVTKSFDKK